MRMFPIILIVVLVGCTNSKNDKKAPTESQFEIIKSDVSKIDQNGFLKMSDINVKELLSALVLEEGENGTLNILTTIGQTKSDWLNKNDLEFLISKIESDQKAKCINRAISSFLPDSKNMTIGNQSISIIESFRNNEPFPNRLYVCKTYDKEKILEIKNWWEKYKNGS